MNDVSTTISQFPGFKISNSHFRIGSKIHISDFYYAKRFFQNSFFSSRLAFIIADEIKKTTSPEQLAKFKLNGLTLMGYGIYSEFLLSLVEKFLRAGWLMSRDQLNHNLILDSENLKLIKQHPVLGHILIVVPIASTFSTAIKIEEEMRKLFPESQMIYPHINALYISDGKPSGELTELEKDFGWESKDLLNKIINIKAYFDEKGEPKPQKFFLSLDSEWHHVDNCSLCFPKKDGHEDLLGESPLFETDRTAVTPTLIFSLPQGRVIQPDDLRRPFTLNADLIQYGHHTRNNSHFLFSIRTEEFLTVNQAPVVTWLKELKATLFEQLKIQESDQILIVSSCHYSNAGFINLINEKLFSSAANVIHYDPTNDYIQNFEMIYGEEIKTADKVLFVDDALKSGAAFAKIYDFIDYTLGQKGATPKTTGISACIVLINISQAFTINSVQRKLLQTDAIYAFANLHLYTSLSHDEESPLVIEEQRYTQLLHDSFLDSLKTHYLRQLAKLTAQDRNYTDEVKKERHLNMLEVTHRIYQYFAITTHKNFSDFTFEQFRDEIFLPAVIPQSFASFGPEKYSKLPPRDAALLKVLSQSPFLQYEPLRKKAFKWVITLLDEQLVKVKEAINSRAFDYGVFEDLKFLIRRAGLVNSNYLISKKMLTFLLDVYGPNGINAIVTHTNSQLAEAGKHGSLFTDEDVKEAKDRLENLNGFSIFYAAQIKELLLRNEDRSIYLERLIRHFASAAGPGFRQLLRILKDENCIIIAKFYGFIELQPKWKFLYSGKIIDEQYDPIVKLLKKIESTRHYKHQSLQKFFTSGGFAETNAPSENKHFLIYLWLMFFISFDKQKEELSLDKKTDLIFKKLKELFRAYNAEIEDLGMFFIVKSSPKSDPLLVYDKNSQGLGVLDSLNWNKNNPLLEKFLNGRPDASKTYHKSVIEYVRDDQEKVWLDLYGLSERTEEPELDFTLLPKLADRLVLVRLNKRISFSEEKPQGIIGFYFKNTKPGITDPNIIRYLQLLRTPLSLFVETHHENNEFRDWQVAEATRKLVLLSGHGKEMLKMLSREDKRYFKIAQNLEYLQMIILFNKSLSDQGGDDDVLKRFNEFYHVEGEKSITVKYFASLAELANDIYKRSEIEDEVPCIVKVECLPESFPFAFNSNILTLICFELIVNAKKNRWNFLPGEVIGGYQENTLTIHAHIEDGPAVKSQLKLEITNIGPEIEGDELEKLNNPNQNIKSDNAVAGTALLKTLVFRFLNGCLEFKSTPISTADRLSTFKVIVTLPEMPEDAR